MEAERRPLRPEELERLKELLLFRKQEVAREDPQSPLLREIEQALLKLARGEYGRCVDCGKWIRIQRLETIPWARRCRTCQERWEMLQAVE
ncbi:TraR/DksA C4-type zinc finger protein [Thermosulfurimonas sp.]|uniref:TraR/DksA family transcriptional regulator n=1 Tax=Thermosulfurimonas sp. TaxID=2080236 RepID=UPI0025D79923|nr:TraR/DksA C4-type zinc finger protein [Thermosulfurimonas sp.]